MMTLRIEITQREKWSKVTFRGLSPLTHAGDSARVKTRE